MRHSRSYCVISEFHLCIFAVSLFHVSLPGKTEKSAKPITSRLCGYKKDPAIDCLNKQFILRGVFHMVGVTGFEPTASWSRTKRATNCATPRNKKSQQKLSTAKWLGMRGSNSHGRSQSPLHYHYANPHWACVVGCCVALNALIL